VAIAIFKASSKGLAELLNSDGTRAVVREKAEQVLARAKQTAPHKSGAYEASLHLEDDTTDRAVVRVVAGIDYGIAVEARTGHLARSLDGALI
jgi:hypothetical protein